MRGVAVSFDNHDLAALVSERRPLYVNVSVRAVLVRNGDGTFCEVGDVVSVKGDVTVVQTRGALGSVAGKVTLR